MEKDLQEIMKFQGRVDRENRRITHVAVLGNKSRNGRIYTNTAMESVVKFLKAGKKSFLDHPSMLGQSVRDLLGKFDNPKLENNMIYADLTLLESSVGKDLLLEVAETCPDVLGFSISARGRFAENADADGREVVEDVVALKSVDAVSQPACTNGVFESEQTEELTELRAEVADLKEKIRQKDLVIKYRDKQLKEKKEETKIIKPKTSKEEFFADLNKHL